MGHRFLLSVSACVLFLCAGCGTPSARIKKNPELFASYPPEVQTTIQQGKVDIGYNKEMTHMALGDPDRRYARTTADGETEVWAYVDTYTTTERQQVSGPFRARAADGSTRTIRDTLWVDVQQRHELERLRVEFVNGRIAAIEESSR